MDSFRIFVSKGRSVVAFEVPVGTRGGLRFDPGIDAGLYQIHSFEVRFK
jgi:hypothetical protein